MIFFGLWSMCMSVFDPVLLVFGHKRLTDVSYVQGGRFYSIFRYLQGNKWD